MNLGKSVQTPPAGDFLQGRCFGFCHALLSIPHWGLRIPHSPFVLDGGLGLSSFA